MRFTMDGHEPLRVDNADYHVNCYDKDDLIKSQYVLAPRPPNFARAGRMLWSTVRTNAPASGGSGRVRAGALARTIAAVTVPMACEYVKSN